MRNLPLIGAMLLLTGNALAHGDSSAGQPGAASDADRTITIIATDLKFTPAGVTVRAGETVKFVISNQGKLSHEFVIGTKTEQDQHEREMQAMGDMQHMETNAISLRPGETSFLVWKFGAAGNLVYGCHVPGHYVAGMAGIIHVK